MNKEYLQKRVWYNNINSYQKATTSFARIVNNILKNEEVDEKDEEKNKATTR